MLKSSMISIKTCVQTVTFAHVFGKYANLRLNEKLPKQTFAYFSNTCALDELQDSLWIAQTTPLGTDFGLVIACISREPC